MESERINDVAEQELKKLEFRVGELIQTCERLKQENHLLREKNERLSADRLSLAERNELARSRVESMINRLKSMEHVA